MSQIDRVAKIRLLVQE